MIVGPHRIVLDSEALSKLATGGRSMQPWMAFARRTDSTIHTSSVTLAEVTDGTARDVGVRRIMKTLDVVDTTEEIGYSAGKLRAGAASSRRKPRDLTVDAVVAATALSLQPPVVVLTSDRGDLDLLLDGTDALVESIG